MDKLNITVNIEIENLTEVKEELTQVNDLLIEVENRLKSIEQKELNLKVFKCFLYIISIFKFFEYTLEPI